VQVHAENDPIVCLQTGRKASAGREPTLADYLKFPTNVSALYRPAKLMKAQGKA